MPEMLSNPQPIGFSIKRALELNNYQLQEIIEIEKVCKLSKWNKEDYRIESSRHNSVFLIADTGDIVDSPKNNVIGFILLRINFFEEHNKVNVSNRNDADLLNFGVTTRYQNMGIGSALFDEAHSTLSKLDISAVWLEVRASNSVAIKFYEKKGFVVIQTRKNFYAEPVEHALLMKLDLSNR